MLVHKIKDNHSIPIENWDNYLKKLYDSPNTMDTILNTLIKEDVFSLEDVESSINKLTNGKAKDIEGYQVEIFKMTIFIRIPHLHKLLNFFVQRGFPQLWTQILIVPIFKNGDKRIPSNYMTIMLSHILAKLNGLILEKKLSLWLENHGKRDKGQAGFRIHHSTIDHLVTLKIIAEECSNSKLNLFCCFVDFRKSFDIVPRDKLWKRLE